MDRPPVRIQLWGLYCFGGTWVDRLRPPPDAGALLRTGPVVWRCAMAVLLIGYARVSTDQQDLTAQRDGLTALGVAAKGP